MKLGSRRSSSCTLFGEVQINNLLEYLKRMLVMIMDVLCQNSISFSSLSFLISNLNIPTIFVSVQSTPTFALKSSWMMVTSLFESCDSISAKMLSNLSISFYSDVELNFTMIILSLTVFYSNIKSDHVLSTIIAKPFLKLVSFSEYMILFPTEVL